MTELAKIAKEHSIPKDEVTVTYNGFIEKETERGTPKKLQKQRALRRTELFYKKGAIGGPTESIELIILGSKEAMDSSGKDKATAAEIWEENPNKAIAEGWCDDDGVPLDRMANFPSGGGKNNNYGKPLQTRMMRVIVGLKEESGKIITFIVNGKQATNMEIPIFRRVTINGKKKTETQFNGTKSTKILCDETEMMANLEDIISKKAAAFVTPIDQIDEWVTTHGKKDILITIGDVLTIDMEPNAGGSRSVFLDNGTDYGQRLFVPGHVPIYFGEQSKIILFGSAKPGKEDYGPSVTAMGMYAIPDYMYEPEGNGEYADESIDYTENESLAAAGQPEDDQPDDQDQLEGKPQPKSNKKPVTPTLLLNVLAANGGRIGISEIIAQAVSQGYDGDKIDSVIKNLMDTGEVFEPQIGTIAISEKPAEEKPKGWD